MSWRTLLLGLLAFAVALVVVLPARWVGAVLPAGVQCADWRGTLWRGRCHELRLTVQGAPPVTIETAGWSLHPAPLLRGRLAAEVSLTDARGDATGHVEYGRDGALGLRDVSARILFDPQLPSAMPAGWRGRVEIQQLELDWQANQPRHLQGQLRFFDVRDEQGRELGNFRLDFPSSVAPPFTGQLSDTGGPLQLRGTLQLTPERRWTLNATVTPRPGADAGIIQYLQALGAPDRSGGYPLSATGSFNEPAR